MLKKLGPIAMGSIEYRTSCWRMVITCDVNKTVILCFNSYDHTGIPTSFNLGGEIIHLTDQTKVLGVVLDSKLTLQKNCILLQTAQQACPQ